MLRNMPLYKDLPYVKGGDSLKAIINGKIIMEHQIVLHHAVLFNEKIINIIPEKELDQYHISEKIDIDGNFLSPGFIDVHVHGCSGFDTMDDDEKALNEIRSSIPRAGVTSFLPTTMTMEFDKIDQSMQLIRRAMGKIDGAEVLGCHMEGPFINANYKGAQDKKHIMSPDFHKIKTYLDVIKIITIAPEVVGDSHFIEACTERGVIVSIGHSSATYDQGISAILAGVSHMTHTFNALPPLHHRKPGAVGAAMDHEGVICEVIADNIHVHPAMQRLLLKVKGVDKIILITDAMRACMLWDGQYDLGGQIVTVAKGEARLTDGVIAGSVLLMNKGVKNFMDNTGLDLVNVIRLVTVNPAKQIGVFTDKGSIEVGKHADFTIFDDSLTIFASFVRGNLLYNDVASWR